MSLSSSGTATAARSSELRDRIDAVLEAALHQKITDTPDEALKQAYATLRDFTLRPGKRIRPLFCYWGWRGAGGVDDGVVVHAAAALELFHASCLIHDDIIDVSATRRGLPTVHRLLADVHARSSWRGDAGSFGLNAAIVTGDLGMIAADEVFAASGLNHDQLQVAGAYFSAMRIEANCGQYLELREQATGGSLASAMRIIRLKTASYTVRRPLQIGGALAAAGDELIEAYGDLGNLVGEAYQLRDDLLSSLGTPEQSGKPNIDDIRGGKPTALIALARERSDRVQRARIGATYGNPRTTPEAADTLREILVETGAVQTVEDMIDQRSSQALETLDTAPIEPTAKRALAELVDLACHRAI